MSNAEEEEEDGDNPLEALIQDVDATKTIVEESSVEINKVEEDEKKKKNKKKKQKQNEGNDDDDFEEKDEKEEAERSNMMVVDENGNINEDALILSSSPPTDSLEEVDDLVDEDGKENGGKNSNLHLQNTTLTVANQNTNNNNNNSINYEMQRVKLYKLNAEGYWDDTGTGIVSCEYVDVFSSMGLVVYPEEEGEEEEEEEEDDDDNDKEKERRERDGEAAAIAGGKDDKEEEEEEEKSIQKKRRRRSASATTTTKPTPLLVHKILEEHQHQQEPAYSRSGQSTIISWVEPRESIDLALSFQSIDGCDFIWEQIKNAQRRNSMSIDADNKEGDAMMMNNKIFSKNELNNNNNNNMRSPFDLEDLENDDNHLNHDGSGGPEGDLVDGFNHQRNQHIRGNIDEYGEFTGKSFYYEGDDSQSAGHHHHQFHRAAPAKLPEPTLSELSNITKVLNECSPFQRESIASMILNTPDYLKRLLSIFTTCEDLEDEEGLHEMYRCVKGMVMLNEANLFDCMFSEEFVWEVVGSLEYDPDVPAENRTHHRDFLRNVAVFKEVVPITNEVTKAKIHQTYRIQYLKDVILPSVLDEQVFQTLHSIMLFNNAEVVRELDEDPLFLDALFEKLNAATTSTATEENEEWTDLIFFLQELCQLATGLHIQHRTELYQKLYELDLLNVLTLALTKGNSEQVQVKAADVFMSALLHDPVILREKLVKQEEYAMMSELVRLFLDGDDGLQGTVLEILTILADPDNMDQETEKNTYLEMFYDHFVDKLTERISFGSVNEEECKKKTSKNGADENDDDDNGGDAAAEKKEHLQYVQPWSLTKIVDLLVFMAQHHGYRIKYYILRNNVLVKVLALTKRKEKFVVLAALKLLRACVGLKDEFYNRYLVKSDLFEPIVRSFRANGEKYNLLNSAILELVDFVRRENVRNLVAHLLEKFKDFIDTVEYCETFKLLKERHEMNINPSKETTTVTTSSIQPAPSLNGSEISSGYLSRETIAARAAHDAARRRRDSSMTQDEEDYFDSDDYQDGSEGDSGGSGGRKSTSTGSGSPPPPISTHRPPDFMNSPKRQRSLSPPLIDPSHGPTAQVHLLPGFRNSPQRPIKRESTPTTSFEGPEKQPTSTSPSSKNKNNEELVTSKKRNLSPSPSPEKEQKEDSGNNNGDDDGNKKKKKKVGVLDLFGDDDEEKSMSERKAFLPPPQTSRENGEEEEVKKEREEEKK